MARLTALSFGSAAGAAAARARTRAAAMVRDGAIGMSFGRVPTVRRVSSGYPAGRPGSRGRWTRRPGRQEWPVGGPPVIATYEQRLNSDLRWALDEGSMHFDQTN